VCSVSAATSDSYEARRPLTEKAHISANSERILSQNLWYGHCSESEDAATCCRRGNSLRCLKRVTIVVGTPMKMRALLLARAAAVAAFLFAAAQPVLADARSTAKSQVDFGIKVAQNGLWKEAIYRWEKAAEADPTYAAAWNNLGIGYEHEGRFEDARKAYEKAVALDPKNVLIRQNYDLFKEINDRAKRRNDR
jgi:Flp pilus assembly protein TadD